MTQRKRPVLVATRVTQKDRELLEIAARMEHKPLATLVREIIMPVVYERLTADEAIFGAR